ncbi:MULTISPECIES: HD domain-containing protein [Desulfurella]|uniref:HD domain-containing protein n=1 Tax=Desulfurella multipotens TaxID=79269 RepID=A0A1G6JKA2_9BACT|nr:MULTISPECIES: HD domain-containing protein [Desulfurella]PMP64399.1 MAG: HD domain-containing protein [Desulfurella multipotens]PMP90803.1 MAG: HD domain-containing protein [Desulfurella sp.]SDC19143.1 HD domain-containing protein [Desulfurella multipotens]
MSELEKLSIGKIIKFKLWFENYVDDFIKNYPEKKENLELKRIHTHNVCKESLKIMQYYRKNNECRLSAYIIALFHDIGRFEQYAFFNTFNDRISKDHAELSIKVILENNLLKNINDYTKNIIIKAIENHNKAQLPKCSDYKLNFLSKVIRDADKIDIYRIVTQNYVSKKPNSIVNLELEDRAFISDNVYKSILNKKPVKYEDLKTIMDLKVLHLSWVFDINFIYTFERITRESYLEKIFSTMAQNKQTQIIFQLVEDYVDKRLKLGKNEL